jgi:putative endopeptidase
MRCVPFAHRSISLAATFAAALLGASCTASRPVASSTGTEPHHLQVVDVSFIDSLVKPCVDFFQYAVGAWLAHDTIPAAYSNSGVGKEMADNNEAVLHVVLDDLAARRASIPADSATHKLGVFFETCMDSAAAETAGVNPILPLLAGIDSIDSQEKLLKEIAHLQMLGVDALFGFGPGADPHDAAHYMAWFSQAGLGLPDRDYYFAKGAAADSTRALYLDHVTQLLMLAGEPAADAARDAAQIMALETVLAKASMTRVAMRDPAATDHPLTMVQVSASTPKVAWSDYLQDVGVTVPIARVNVAQPLFLKQIGIALDSVPLATWRSYLRAHLIARAASWLSTPFVQENFRFNSHFSGAKELLPRWKRCLREADGYVGEALGEAYVQRMFSPQDRARAKAVIEDVRAAFRDRLQHLDWMTEPTKTQALAKLDKMGGKIGYPDTWRDYSKLQVREGPFIDNLTMATAFEWQRTINRPGKPVDLTEWDMTVPTVNAYYDPTKNEMVFPAGALMPQTFDAKADLGANYGSLAGSWAGHELTHGFDDQGRHYDAAGNLRDWWTKADSAHFKQQADLVVKQYGGYLQVDTTHVNGALTLGENIADYGGVLTGFDALQHAMQRDGRPATIEGFTPEQRFFLGYAQSFRTHERDASLRTRVTTDEHSPDRWRVNGPLSNSAAFATAFSCKAGDPMVRDVKLVPKIW